MIARLGSFACAVPQRQEETELRMPRLQTARLPQLRQRSVTGPSSGCKNGAPFCRDFTSAAFN